MEKKLSCTYDRYLDHMLLWVSTTLTTSTTTTTQNHSSQTFFCLSFSALQIFKYYHLLLFTCFFILLFIIFLYKTHKRTNRYGDHEKHNKKQQNTLFLNWPINGSFSFSSLFLSFESYKSLQEVKSNFSNIFKYLQSFF